MVANPYAPITFGTSNLPASGMPWVFGQGFDRSDHLVKLLGRQPLELALGSPFKQDLIHRGHIPRGSPPVF